MTQLEAIAALFQQIDNSLEDLRERHEAAGEADERDRVERHILKIQVCYRLIDPGSDWRLHRKTRLSRCIQLMRAGCDAGGSRAD